jgi:hypothetical protein
MAVLNVNVPFPLIVRLSAALFFRTRPVLPLAKPLTVPPIVKGPAVEPVPPVVAEAVFLKLQPARRAGMTNAIAIRRDFVRGFIRDS